MKQIPIILNNFNRLSSTRHMYEFLKNRGFTHITILDNASTYPPLLDWYATLPAAEVVRFAQNLGPHSLFSSGYIRQLVNSEWTVYSDSDLELNPLMPDDFLEIMQSLLIKYQEKKIGLALRIDDVPPGCYRNCFTGSIEWEKQFWEHELEKDVYRALVDTTFCLLRHPREHDLQALRIAGNFTARHLPWYQDYAALTAEEIYFVEHASPQSGLRNGYLAWLEAQQAGSKRARPYFIAVYTNQVKNYCDKQFFSNLHTLSGGAPVHVIDNTTGDAYYHALNQLFRNNGYDNFQLWHLDVPEQPAESCFQRRVCDSVNHLRNIYLQQTDLPYFLIIETDVIPPANLLDKFDSSMDRLNNHDAGWGIIGGLYYEGFHRYDFDTGSTSLEKVVHCLSGCTVYKRSLIEEFPFRYNPADLGPFPDAFICYDAGRAYSFYNEHQIRCDHLHNPVNGLRVSVDITATG